MRLWLVGLVAFSMAAMAQEAGPLPQRKIVGKTSFSLAVTASKYWNFLARANGGPAAGWIHWRFDVEDSTGKREDFGYGPRGFHRGAFAPGPLKVTVFADEILSVAFVEEPRAGEALKLNVNARAAEFGLKDVFLLGPGDFVVNEVDNAAHVAREGNGVRIVAEKPVVAVMFRPSAEIERMAGRVRERSNARDGGKVFPWRGKAQERTIGNGSVLRYAPVKWLETTNRVEVEVMIRHRPVEFLVDFGKEKAGP